jgi:hypothetical protein
MSEVHKSGEPDSPRARRAHVEFMRVWDEGYVADASTFVAMHVQGVAILSGGRLRTDDGRLDRAAITDWVTAAASGLPYARLRLLRSPLGLTAPGWVPDESFDAARHLRFSDPPVACSPEALPELIGWQSGPLDLDRPLWRLQFTALDDGGVAMGLLMHHSSGDALRTLKLLSALTGNAPGVVPDAAADPFADVRAPRSSELPLLALRGWIDEGTGAGERWREYWRKPLTRRLRRVGGRLLRPLRESRTKDGPQPDRHASYFTVPSEEVQDHAAQLGATMNDLVVAASLRAGERGRGAASVRVPVMRRRTEDSRNRVADLRITDKGAASFAELVDSVRAQLRAGDDADVETRIDEIGYATLVPWLSRPRYLLGARLDQLIVLPAALPSDALSAFSLLYDGRLTVVASTPASTEIEPLMDRLREALTGALAH